MSTAIEALRVLQRFKNAILEGPPGTGKTHVVAEIAAAWHQHTGRELGGHGHGKYAITFHPSTTYEDFIEGLRYDEAKGEFVRRDGFLVNVITEAKKHPERDYLVLLDELNRANVPKVLGDVLLCMEGTKRATHSEDEGWTKGMEVTLPYSGKQFFIPDNVYLLGTMNTSDRSIAPLDSALRRRFGFVRVNPLSGPELEAAIERVDGAPARAAMQGSIDALTNLNGALRDCLGPDAMLGHSYLFGFAPTAGPTGAMPDPLQQLRDVVSRVHGTDVFWLEVASTSGGAGNQLDIPDQKGQRPGLQPVFYPMASGGNPPTRNPSPIGQQDRVDIHFRGGTLIGCTIEYNTGGSNYRFKYSGKTVNGDGIFSLTPRGSLEQHIHVFVRRPDATLDLLLLPRDAETLTALQQVSVAPDGWTARTMPNASGREYGVVDLAAFHATANPDDRTPDEDAVWMVWRYAVIPQLIETVTQLGVPDLLDPSTRDSVLSHIGKADLGDRFATFDKFLASLSLYVRLEGQGLSRGLILSEVPLEVPASIVANGGSDGDDRGDAD